MNLAIRKAKQRKIKMKITIGNEGKFVLNFAFFSQADRKAKEGNHFLAVSIFLR